MSDTPEIFKDLIAGLITGGASALTTFLASIRDIRKRLKDLEERVGSSSNETKTGLFLALTLLEESVRKIRRELDRWDEDPPSWAQKLFAKARTASGAFNTVSFQQEFEERIESRLRTFTERIRRLEDSVEHALVSGDFAEKKDFEEEVKKRDKEMASFREQLASINGVLRGLMAALDFIDQTRKLGR